MSFADAIHTKAVDLAKLSIEMTTAAGSGHPSTAMSLAHLVSVLMYHQMRYDPKEPSHPTADRLVLSEGHAVPIIYAACADVGVYAKFDGKLRAMTREDAMTLRDIDSPVDGHPHPQVGFPFFDAATGSLGQGLSVAAGMGEAAKMDDSPRNIYCIIGDGESREGQIWEACDHLVDNALTNVIPIFNCNALAQSDWVSPQQSSEVLAEKLSAYGFIVRVIDGHDPLSIKHTFDELPVIQNGNRPLAIVAETVKGWGAASEQGMGHHGSAIKEPKPVYAELDATLKDLVSNSQSKYDLEIREPENPDAAPTTIAGRHEPSHQIQPVSYEEAMTSQGKEKKLGDKFAPRAAYGVALRALGEASDRIVATDGDVKNSTHAVDFFEKFPERFVEGRIAEQNMISLAAGLSAGGYIPFVSTFAKFVMRAYDQLEMAILGGANLKVTGSHAGVTLAADGPSQMSLPDVAFFRGFCHANNFNGEPAVRYFFPSDAVSAYACTTMMANVDGACYQRTLREAVKPLYDKGDTDFEVGGCRVVREGSDFVFAASGYMVHECLKACDEQKLNASVVDCYSFPMKADALIELAEKNGGKIVTVEDNFTGGLDAEVALAVANAGSSVRVQNLFVRHLAKSGRTATDVLRFLSLDAESIAKAVKK